MKTPQEILYDRIDKASLKLYLALSFVPPDIHQIDLDRRAKEVLNECFNKLENLLLEYRDYLGGC